MTITVAPEQRAFDVRVTGAAGSVISARAVLGGICLTFNSVDRGRTWRLVRVEADGEATPTGRLGRRAEARTTRQRGGDR